MGDWGDCCAVIEREALLLLGAATCQLVSDTQSFGVQHVRVLIERLLQKLSSLATPAVYPLLIPGQLLVLHVAAALPENVHTYNT
jgi:hypothetical protein